MNGGRLLIVDDDRVAMKNLEQVMKKEGYAVTATQSASNALALLEKQSFDVVLTELRMEKLDGMQILKRCRASHPDTEVVLISGQAALGSAVEAMRHGAFHYLAKPARPEEVREVVAEALEKKLSQDADQLQCVIGKGKVFYVPFGESQCPKLDDYADGTDTLQFISSL